MSILDGLNDKQRQAVTTLDGYIRVIAGAGSGKTKALTHRFAYLVKEVGIQPRNIICVTFTNKAAGEMKRRVKELLGDGYDTSLITTYHGFCVRVLREDIGRLFFPENFQILDVADQKKILEEIYDQLDIKLDYSSFEQILEAIGKYKQNAGYVELMTDPAASINAEAAGDLNQQIIMLYLQRQKKLYGLDFNDLINFVFALFDKFGEVRSKWQERLHYIQVDEFQDSSQREFSLIDILGAVNKNLFVVGDPDQNIYEWRGADMGIIVDFDKTYPDTETIIMDQNYRSTPEILAVANSLISRNKVRVKKDLFTRNPSGSMVEHRHAADENEEAAWIISKIKELVRKGGKYSDIAILYRASFLSRFIEQAFLKGDIPYEIQGGLRFFDRMEIKDAIAFLRLIAYGDDMSLLRVVNVPKRKIGKSRIAYLKEKAAEDSLALYQCLAARCGDPVFKGTGAAEFISVIEGLKAERDKLKVSDLLQKALKDTGYEQYVRENGDMERLDNIAELQRTVTQYEAGYGEELPLEAFLQQVSLQIEGEADGGRDCVKLMTIHTSKGLEFPAVFVCGLTDGIFPSRRTLEERKQEGLEEERRLCFVAFTRARERLFMTDSEGFGNKGAKKLPSRFIFEIDDRLYQRIGRIPEDLVKELKKQSDANAPDTGGYRFAAGDEVAHKLLGLGTVESVDTVHRTYNIRFKKNNALRPIAADFEGLSHAGGSRPGEGVGEAGDADDVTQLALYAANERKQPQSTDDGENLKRESLGYIDGHKAVQTYKPADKSADIGEEKKTAKSGEGGDNLWLKDDVPKSGWACTGITDLGAPTGICGMCGKQIIRYVHHMHHQDYHMSVGAGCVCAGKMEGNLQAAKEREADYKNQKVRLETFLKKPWHKTGKGNYYLRYKGIVITVLPDKWHRGKWKFVMNGKYSPLFSTQEEAKRGAFYGYEAMVKQPDSGNDTESPEDAAGTIV